MQADALPVIAVNFAAKVANHLLQQDSGRQTAAVAVGEIGDGLGAAGTLGDTGGQPEGCQLNIQFTPVSCMCRSLCLVWSNVVVFDAVRLVGGLLDGGVGQSNLDMLNSGV